MEGKGKHRRVRSPEATGAKVVGKAVVGLVSSVAVAGGASATFANVASNSQTSDTQHSRADLAYGENNEQPSDLRTTDLASNGVASNGMDIAPHVVADETPKGDGSAANCDATAAKSTQQLIQALSPDCQNSTAERTAAAQELGNRGTFVADQTNRLFFEPVTVAADRITEAAQMTTQQLIDRLSPDRDVSQDDRTAAFKGLQDRGIQILDPDTNQLHFSPQTLIPGNSGGKSEDKSDDRGDSKPPADEAAGQDLPGLSDVSASDLPGLSEGSDRPGLIGAAGADSDELGLPGVGSDQLGQPGAGSDELGLPGVGSDQLGLPGAGWTSSVCRVLVPMSLVCRVWVRISSVCRAWVRTSSVCLRLRSRTRALSPRLRTPRRVVWVRPWALTTSVRATAKA